MRALPKSARQVYVVMGRRGVKWAMAGWFGSLILAITDFVIAALLAVLLISLGVIDEGSAPRWFGVDLHQAMPVPVWLGLFLAGVLRAGCQLLSQHSGFALLELVRARLRWIHGYELLMRRRRAWALSEMNVITGDVIPKASDFVLYAALLVSAAGGVAVVGIGMFAAAWRESLIGLGCLSLAGVAIYEINRRIAIASGEIARKQELIERTLVRICRNWLLIRVLNLKQVEHPRYRGAVGAYYQQGVRVLFSRSLSMALPPLLGIVALSVILFFSLRHFHTGAASVLAFFYLFIRFTQSLAEAADRIAAMSHRRAQFQAAYAMVAAIPEPHRKVALEAESRILPVPCPRTTTGVEPNRVTTHDNGERPSEAATVSLTEVSFAWPHSAKSLFEGVSLTVPAGTQFGLVGPSGSGKSTLLGLILGILEPQVGSVEIDWVSSEEYVQRNSVGYVGPDPCLIHGSLRDNLLYGANRRLNDRELFEALDLVRLGRTQELGGRTLDFEIQENGDGLSSGQRQRLALARAFLRRPTLLVLDEIAANLDTELEKEVAELLCRLRGDCTQIIVSHRLELLRDADQLLSLNGRGGWELTCRPMHAAVRSV